MVDAALGSAEKKSRHLLRAELLLGFLPFLVAAILVALQIPKGKVYAGTDPGFSLIGQLPPLWNQLWPTWSWNGVGSVDFYNWILVPFYIPIIALHGAHVSPSTVSRLYETLEFGGVGFAAFRLALAVLPGRCGASLISATTVAFLAMFSLWGALLLLIPASIFQAAFIVWPLLLAWEIRLLSARRSQIEVSGFAILFACGLATNLAHGVVAIAIMASYAIVAGVLWNAAAEALRVAKVTAFLVFVALLPFWLPIIGYKIFYGGPLFANANLSQTGTLISHAETSASLSSFAALLRFNTIIWWPFTTQSASFQSWIASSLLFIFPSFIFIGLYNRSVAKGERCFWGAAWIASLFLAKGMHEPFGGYYATLLTSPGGEMFREANDKFLLAVWLTSIPLAALGVMSVFKLRAARLVIGLCIIVIATRFFMTPVFSTEFITSVPDDYSRVRGILASKPYGRLFSFAPSSFSEQNSLYWFHGSNLDQMLFLNPVTYSSEFQTLGMSRSPVMNDDDLVAAQEFPEDRRLMTILGTRYIVVHKDFSQYFDMALQHTNDRVNGPGQSAAFKARCDRDPALSLLYNGPDLALYEIRNPGATLSAIGKAHAVSGYSNTMFALQQISGATRAFLFSGNQDGESAVQSLPRRAFRDEVLTYVWPPTKGLRSDEVLIVPAKERAISRSFSQMRLPTSYVGSMPPGDVIAGVTPTGLSVRFPLLTAGRYKWAAYIKHGPGYSRAWEANSLDATRTAAPKLSPADFGDTGSVLALGGSKVMQFSRSVFQPFNGDGHLFVAIRALRGGAPVFGIARLTLIEAGQRYNYWHKLDAWTDSTAPMKMPIGVEPAAATLTQDYDVALAARNASFNDASLSAIRRPDTTLESITIYLPVRTSAVLPPSVVTLRYYDSAKDYQLRSAPIERIHADRIAFHGMPALPLSRRPVESLQIPASSPAGRISVSYRVNEPVTKVTALRWFALPEVATAFSANVYYRAGNVKGMKSVALKPMWVADFLKSMSPIPIGMEPSAPRKNDRVLLEVDLRSLVPQSRRATVEKVVVQMRLLARAEDSALIAFSRLYLVGESSEVAPIVVDNHFFKPASASRSVSDDYVAIMPPLMVSSANTLRITVPNGFSDAASAIRLGNGIADEPVTKGNVSAELGGIHVAREGFVELGTMYNRGWEIRTGRPSTGFLSGLRTFLQTRRTSSTHVVMDGFANGWWVAPGDYAVLYMPQVLRELSVVLLLAILLVWIAASLLSFYTARSG